MSAFEPSPEPHHRPDRSFHHLVWEKSNLAMRTSMVLDGLGLFALAIAAIALLGAGVSDNDLTAGQLVRLCITTLNAGVLMLASARILDMIDKFRNRVDPEGRPYRPKRSADHAFASPAAAGNAGKDMVAAPDVNREAADKPVPGVIADVVYSPAWHGRGHAAPPSNLPERQGEPSTPDLESGVLRQTTDIPDNTTPKSIH